MHSMLAGLTLAADLVPRSYVDWVLKDPAGQKVGLLIAVVVGLVLLIIIFKTMRWAAARANVFIGLSILAAGLYYGSILIFNLGPVGWAVAGIVIFGMFLGAALFLTQGK